MQYPSRASQLAAWAILVLLILVPATVLLTGRKTSLAWLAWTVVSSWAALDSALLTRLAFPERHSPARTVFIMMLAAVNMLLSVTLALWPAAWISDVR